jgi:hypothetical protein
MSVLSGLNGVVARKELVIKLSQHTPPAVVAATSRLERAARLVANVDTVKVSTL